MVLVLIERNNLSTPLIIQPCSVFSTLPLLVQHRWHVSANYNSIKDYHVSTTFDSTNSIVDT